MKAIKQHAFTLIEVMIVVAIIGILAAIAVPSYLDYVVRARAGEVLSFAGLGKTDLMDAYTKDGSMPQVADEEVVNFLTKLEGSTYIQSAVASRDTDNQMTITLTLTSELGSGLGGQTWNFVYVVEPGGSGISLDCSTATLSPSYRPTTCR